jgi:hypothetical protein
MIVDIFCDLTTIDDPESYFLVIKVHLWSETEIPLMMGNNEQNWISMYPLISIWTLHIVFVCPGVITIMFQDV